MGLIKAALDAVGGTLADQWIDFFAIDSLPDDVLVIRGQRYTAGRGSNTKGSDNVISNGSGIVVADGQAAAVVDNGLVVEFAAAPGRYTYDSSSEPSIFAAGGFSANLGAVFQAGIERFKHGGSVAKDQRVYYFNTKEILGNKYGTPNPVPFRVVDQNIGLDIDISIRCNGQYSYRLTNPILFYQNIAGNVAQAYTRDLLDPQLKTEVLTALQPAFAKISALGIRYSALPGNTVELSQALNEVLSTAWKERGIEIATFGVNSVTASPEDEQMIKDLQKAAVLRDPNMAAATLAAAQADAMRDAAKNDAGAMTGFMGLGMAQSSGGANPAQLFQQGQAYAQGRPAVPPTAYPVAADGGFPTTNQGAWAPPPAAPAPTDPNAFAPPAVDLAGAWSCPACGKTGNTGKFCSECGSPRPA
ncbi:MAG: SPFH domain-containing protein [Propionibacteriaceae bacterium]|jgi:membrane protease subunit (stomatin/prohibitin family)|nr:SPFH domain-containing protein [Propionibacteriaceae bacterium]